MDNNDKAKTRARTEQHSADEDSEVNFVLLDKGNLPSAAEVAKEGLESTKEEPKVGLIKSLPTLTFYQKTYANSCGNNDQKALKVVKDYESQAKIKRLRIELNQIIAGKVSDELCTRVVGPARKGRYGSYEDWAKLMLSFLRG